MPLDDVNEDGQERPAEPKIECSMCHQQVRLSESVAMSGRRLCFGCAAAWFDEDETESES
jgi:formylmethanofuran dehydrogenase subunit E